MTTPRDMQRSKVYAAEDAAMRRLGIDIYGRQGKWTLGEAQGFVLRVRATMGARIPELVDPITVRPGRSKAGARRDHLILCGWARFDWVICHELSHTINIRRNPEHNTASHGPEFCAIYLDLVANMIGDEAYTALVGEFIAKRVVYRPQAQLMEQLRLAAKPRRP